jgi:CAAX protease family protein
MRWRVADAVVCFVVSFIAGQIGLIIAIGFGAAVESVPSLIGGLLGTWVGFVVAPWVLSRNRGSGSLVRDLGLRFASWWDVGLGLVVGVGTYVVVLDALYPPLLSFLRRLSGHKVSVGGTAKHLGSLGRGPGFVAFAVAVAIGAPIAEEIFFRGVLLRALVRRAGEAWGAVLCGVLFGLAHATGTEAAALPALMVFGVILAVLANRTGRLGPGIAAHVAFNGITVLALTASR